MADGGHSPRVVSSAGELDGAVATLREFLHRSGALRVVALVRGEGGRPAVVDCERFAPVEIEQAGELLRMEHDAVLTAPPAELGQVRQLPPFDVDAETGEVRGIVGGLAHLGDTVRALADALGQENVAMAVYETSDEDAPITVTARAGGAEPVVVAIGDTQFELPGQAR
jgi:hypothetical protein